MPKKTISEINVGKQFKIGNERLSISANEIYYDVIGKIMYMYMYIFFKYCNSNYEIHLYKSIFIEVLKNI